MEFGQNVTRTSGATFLRKSKEIYFRYDISRYTRIGTCVAV